MERDLITMVVLLGGAAGAPFAARRLRVPSAIVEILYGIVVFSFVLHEKPHWVLFLKEAGLIYLMFIAGMELDLEELKKGGRFLWYTAAPLAAFVVMPFIFVRLGYPFYLGLVVSVLSAGVVVPVLKETGAMETGVGRDAVGMALTGELLSILVLTGVDIYVRHGFSPGAALSAARLAALFFGAFIFLKLLYLLAWWNPGSVERVMKSEDPVEEGIRAVVFVAFAGALLSLGAGVEPILGSFLGGAVFSHVFKHKGRFEDKVNAVGFGFFVPMFFIGVGADFSLGLLGSPGGVTFALFLTAMVFVSNLGVMLVCPLMRSGWLGAASVTLLLSAPLSMMIVAGTIGLKTELLDGPAFDSVVLAAVLSGLIYPTLFRPLVKYVNKIESGTGGPGESRVSGAAPGA